MLNRWIGILCLGVMLSANLALFLHDILPALTAGDPPRPEVVTMTTGAERWVQAAIYRDGVGRSMELIGRSWTHLRRGPNIGIHEVSSYIYPLRMELPGQSVQTTPALRLELNIVYQRDMELMSEMQLRVHGLPLDFSVEGDLLADQFPCVWRFGPQSGSFILDADATRAFGDALRPFQRLPHLEVGQTWRMQVLNPLAKLVPGFADRGFKAESFLVEVKRREKIIVGGKEIDALRVEAPTSVGWVTDDGRVVRQEVDVPLLGRVTILDEPFERRLYQRTAQEFRDILGAPESLHPDQEAREPDDE